MADRWTTLSVLTWTTGRFSQAGLDSARLDAEVLVAHGLGLQRVALYTQFDKPLAPEELAGVRDLIKRRLAGEPVAYITGKREFWSMSFDVDPRVLIPRPDSETLVEAVLARIVDRQAALTIADIGTGSGALAIALAKELPAARVIATDVSEAAAEVARGNAERLVPGRVEVRVGDLLAALPAGTRLDVLVSNPPYVTHTELGELSVEVRREPRGALDGGVEGLDLLRKIAADAPRWLEPSGHLALEHGYTQGPAVARLIGDAGFERVETRADLGGHPRVTLGTLPE